MKPQRRKRVAAALWFYYDSGFAARIWGQIGQFVPLIVGVIDFKGRDDWYFQLIEQRVIFLGIPILVISMDGLARYSVTAPRRNCSKASSTLFPQPEAAETIARNGSQRLPFRPDALNSYISTVQVSNLRLQFPLIIVVIFKNLLVFDTMLTSRLANYKMSVFNRMYNDLGKEEDYA